MDSRLSLKGWRAWRSLRPLLALSCASLLVYCPLDAAWAEDVPFKPRYDGIERKTKRKSSAPKATPTPATPPIYSFGRYAQEFAAICDLLQVDGRRERFVTFATAQEKRETGCTSCRLFARQVRDSCKERTAAPTPTVAPVVTAEAAPAEQVADAEGGETTESEKTLSTSDTVVASEMVTPVPTTRVGASPARYPSTELVDRLSRFSSELYERDPGVGTLFNALNGFATALLRESDLTVGEREYFGIFVSYLMAAWSDRATPPPAPEDSSSKERIKELFAR